MVRVSPRLLIATAKLATFSFPRNFQRNFRQNFCSFQPKVISERKSAADIGYDIGSTIYYIGVLFTVDFAKELLNRHAQLGVFTLDYGFGRISHLNIGLELRVFEITSVGETVANHRDAEIERWVDECFP